jgi:hypothetical protein
MAHVVPKKIGYNIEYDRTDTELNCILMSTGFHALFDSFEWTLDVFSILDNDNGVEDQFDSTMLIHRPPKPGKGSLSGCVDKVFTVPIQYYASFYAHYYVYLKIHYTGACGRLSNALRYFRECIDSRVFKELRELNTVTDIRNYLTQHYRYDDYSIVVDCCDDDRFRVLSNMRSWRYNTIVSRSQISDKLLGQFEDYQEQLDDPDWIPRSRIN